MVAEFYLIIFLLVAMLIFTWFYSKRAENRGASESVDKTGEQHQG